MKNAWSTCLVMGFIAAGLVGGLCACSAGQPARRAATVTAAGAATGAVVKNQAKKSTKSKIAPDVEVPDRKNIDGRSSR